ncbi:hypothetical protein [Mycobacterium sp. NAZ190054]|uniref:Ig-like domain-containing protein n=1 Tax=Mycobacterium sp. NAZ190054 TaxID=1747766 RepID=UPI0012E3CFCE|nr:hypothetical protein [Mycobacterium sp. NAZ190054]
MGALAVSLGIGLAVANSAGVAYADTDTDTDSSVSSGSNDAEPTSPDPGAEADPEEESDTEDVDVPSDPEDEEPGDEDVPGGDEPDVSDPEAENPGPPVSGADDEPPLEELPEEEPSSSPPDADDHPVTQTPAPSRDSDEAPPDDESAVEPEEPATDLDEGREPPADTVVTSGNDATTDVVTAPESAPPVASSAPSGEEAAESVDVITALVAGLVSPLVDPATPARVPWFDGLLAWVRRQINHTFFNDSPEWGPVTSQQTVTGQVIIDLAARDPNGDPLTYTIVQPEHGSVFRDPITGKFVYTPNTLVTGTPLEDSFKVVISDSSEHLEGVAGLIQGVFHFLARAIGIAEPDEVTLLIPVVANPIVEVPPVLVVSPIAGGTTGDAITVSPIVVITDLDSDRLASATVKLNDAAAGDVLGWGSLPPGVTATTGNGSVTFTGAASVAAYQQLLQSVTLTSSEIGIKTISFSVIDDQGNANPVPAGTVVTVLGLPVEVPPLVVVTPVAAGTVGSPVTITPIVLITDVDSAELSSATVEIADPADGDTLEWGTLPPGVAVTTGDGSVTFTGAASVAAYQQLLASVTLTSTSAGLKSVSFSVVDADGNTSVVPAATVVTVLGLPVEVPPLVVVSPVAAGTVGSAITISPIVIITDLDSDELASAAVVVENPASGDELRWGDLPSGVSAAYADGVLTFTGAASVATYQQLLASVTLTSTGAGIKSVTFSVTDDQGNASAFAAGTVVTVLGLPVEVPPLVVVSPVAAGTVGSAITISPIVVLTDLDSDELDSAKVVLNDPADGDALDYGSLPVGVEASYVDGVLTFTGRASVEDYRQLLASVTLTSAGAGLKSVSFAVTDVDGNTSVVPAGTVVTVLGVPGISVPPVVVVSPVAAGTAGSPITISPIVVLTDLDSDQLDSATVTLNNPAAGDSLEFGSLPAGLEGSYIDGVLTLTGRASVEVYRQLLQSVTLTSTTAGLKSVSFAVTDVDGNTSVVPAGTVVTVLGVPGISVPPVVVVSPVAAGTAGSPITISPIVVLTDLDSDQLDSATVVLQDPADGDVLGYGSLPAGVEASYANGVLTFSGTASVAAYQQLLASVTLTSNMAGLKSVTFGVVDAEGNTNSVPAGTVVTVLGVPGSSIAPVLVATPVAAGTAGSPIVVSPIVVIADLDSDELASATVTVGDPAAGDVLGWGDLPEDVEASYADGVLTFTGAASVEAYRELLQSVTLTSTGGGIKSVSFAVTDIEGNTNTVPAGTVVTVLGVPGSSIAPVLVATPVAAGTAGSPIVISPIVVIADLDSDELGSAIVTVADPAAGDVLGWGTVPEGISAEYAEGVLTFTGAASVDAYRELLQSVTLTSTGGGIKSVSFAVTDIEGNTNTVPAGTVVTVLGVPGSSIAPVLVATPVAAGTAGSAIVISPIVVIADLDSDELGSATVTVGDPAAGDVLGWGDLPEGVEASYAGGVLTFTGAASVDAYRELLQSVTLTSTGGGIKSVSFAVTDIEGNTNSVPAGTVVTVLGVPGSSIAPVLVATPVAAGTAGSPIVISPIVVIADLDSDELGSATVTVSNPSSGDVLEWGDVPGGVEASYSNGVLTFTGNASVEVYRELLQSVTLTSTGGGIKSVGFAVTDIEGNTNTVPAGTVVTVLGVPGSSIAPVLVATPVAAGTAGSPIVISPIVVIADLDSDELGSATVTVGDPTAGDVLGWGTVPEGISAEYAEGVLTFTGNASVEDYRELLQSVTLTSTGAGLKSVSFAIVDADGNASVVPAGTVVTVLGVPGSSIAPVLVATPVAAGTAGSAIVISPIVAIADLDSDELGSATVTVNDPATGDVLGWGDLPEGVDAHYTDGVLTFTGTASVDAYRQLLQSVTLTSAGAGLKSVSFSIVDAEGNAATVPAATVVTVLGLPTALPPLVVVSPIATGTTGSAIVVSPIVVITDLDSDELDSATVTVNDPESGDVLGWGTVPEGISAEYTDGVLTFTGTASVAVYQQLLQSVTLTSTAPGIKTVAFTVTDDQHETSLVAGTAVTVLGLPTAATPVVLTSVVSVAYTAGSSGVSVDAGLIVLDADSEMMTGATVTIVNPASGDLLTFGDLPEGVTATYGSGVLSFDGTASVSAYQQLLRSVKFASESSALATIRMISLQITDDQGRSSIPGTVAVTVLSVPILAKPVVVTSLANVAYTAGNSSVQVDSGLLLLDADSATMTGAVVSIVGGATAGESLGWTPQDGISGTYTDGVLTFEGSATVAAYQQLLRSVTFSTTSEALASIKSISFVVTDGQGNVSTPGLVAVTIVKSPLRIAPLVTTSLANVSYTAGAGAVTVDPFVSVLDLDSTALQGATVKIAGGFASGDVLTFTAPEGITGVYDSSTGTLTLTGTASIGMYEEALRSVQLATGAGALASLKTVSFHVTDAEGTASLLPGNVVVTVLTAPFNLSPLVTTLLGPIYTAGNSAAKVNPLLTVIDLDSSTMSGAVVQVTGNFSAGDVLGFTPVGNISGSYDSATGILTLSGTASTLQYQQVLQSVTFSTNASAPTAVKTITFTVTDTQGGTSLPATALVTVRENNNPVLTAPLGGGLVLLGLPLLSPLAVISDDSEYLQQAYVKIVDKRAGDTLVWDAPAHIQASFSGDTLTLVGQATVAEYQAVIRSIRISKEFSLLPTSRTIRMQVQDVHGLWSNTEESTALFLLA